MAASDSGSHVVMTTRPPAGVSWKESLILSLKRFRSGTPGGTVSCTNMGRSKSPTEGVGAICEMSPDGVARGGVLGIVDFHLNRAAIVFQEKMMRAGSSNHKPPTNGRPHFAAEGTGAGCQVWLTAVR
jgi:hypothetical protein